MIIMNFFKKRKKTIPMDGWLEKIEYIKHEWMHTPAKVDAKLYKNHNGFKYGPIKHVDNLNELSISVSPWEGGNGFIISVAKKGSAMEYPFRDSKFNEISDADMKSIGLIPSGDSHCCKCLKFTVSLKIDGTCQDCFR